MNIGSLILRDVEALLDTKEKNLRCRL